MSLNVTDGDGKINFKNKAPKLVLMLLCTLLVHFLVVSVCGTLVTRSDRDTFILNFSFENVSPAGRTLSPLLVRRIPGTPAHLGVRDYIVQRFRENGWSAEIDAFESSTPNGPRSFYNLIFTLEPSKPKKLVLAAHYDLKDFSKHRGFESFTGAIDAAWSCAFLVELGAAISRTPTSLFQRQDLSPQVILFDGEEAFSHWTSTDSLYGSRHLSQVWHSSGRIKQIELFVLLDLLGGVSSAVPSFFGKTSHVHAYLQKIERALLDSHSVAAKFFQPPQQAASVIQDDHIPFLSRGVPILHLIPHAFPKCWHTPNDNVAALHPPSIHSLSLTLCFFVYDYLNGLIKV